MTVHLLNKNLNRQTIRQTVIHHIGGSLSCFGVLYYQGVFAHILFFRLIAHVTNPFIFTYYIMFNFNQKKSLLYTAASIGMVVTSIATRILLIFWMWSLMIKALIHVYTTCNIASLPMILLLIAFTAAFDIGHIIICTKMVRGFIKHIRSLRNIKLA